MFIIVARERIAPHRAFYFTNGGLTLNRAAAALFARRAIAETAARAINVNDPWVIADVVSNRLSLYRETDVEERRS